MLAAAFIMGLIGSMHCLGMCGPLAIVANRLGQGQGVLNSIIYNGSRIIIYILLGLLFGLLGQVVFLTGLQKWLSTILGLIIIFFALTHIIKPQFNHYLTGRLSFVFKWAARMNRSGHKGMKSVAILGLINGLLPCGLVYLAIAGAIIQISLAGAALYMLIFGLGTLPLMFFLTLTGNRFMSLLRDNYKRALSIALFAFGLFLIYRGMAMELNGVMDNMFSPAAGVMGCEQPNNVR